MPGVEPGQEVANDLAGRVEVVGQLHAAALVDEHAERHGALVGEAEVDDGAGRAVLEDLEVVPLQVPDVAAPAVLHDRVDRHEAHASAEGRHRRLSLAVDRRTCHRSGEDTHEPGQPDLPHVTFPYYKMLASLNVFGTRPSRAVEPPRQSEIM